MLRKVIAPKPHPVRAGLFAALCVVAQGASAGPIGFDTFLQFSFDLAGDPVTGCQPADPGGLFCSPSSGTPTEFLDEPAWTFIAPAGGATLTVVDAFISGDRFEVFDFGASIGITSLPARAAVDCGDDPLVCLANAGMSFGAFALGAGAHSLTLIPTQSNDLGSAYLQVTAAVPEPASLSLALGALGGIWGLRRRQGASQGSAA